MPGTVLHVSLVGVRDLWTWSSLGYDPRTPATCCVLCPPGVCPSRVFSSSVKGGDVLLQLWEASEKGLGSF